jgi:hypothetical protein
MDALEELQRTIRMDYHLQYNHYPSVSTAWTPACIAAIDAMNNGEPYQLIDTPFSGKILAKAMIPFFNLKDFVDWPDE